MPGLFSRLRGRDGATKVKSRKNSQYDDLADNAPAQKRWEDASIRKTVEPEEIYELVKRCTEEIKARGQFLFTGVLRDRY